MANKNNISNQFSTFLKDKRTAMGMTLRQFAIHLYDDEKQNSYLSKIENGKHQVNSDTMQFLLEKLNCRFYIEEL
jgi:transcriptional regulator with XRE-family HTH domain